MSLSSIPRALREVVFARDQGRCRYCRLAQFGHGSIFHIGRATVIALKMNEPIPRIGRACQIMLALLSPT